MRKRFYVCMLAMCAMCLIPGRAQAQWRAGAQGGATYNWYSIDKQYQTDFHYDGAWGWNAALFGQYNFKDWVGLRFELEAAERNYRLKALDYIRSR